MGRSLGLIFLLISLFSSLCLPRLTPGNTSISSRAINYHEIWVFIMSVTEHVANSYEISPVAESPRRAPEKPLHSLPLLNLNAGRSEMLAYFENTWALTEQLFSALVSEEAYYVRPYHKTRHPLIFYYAHPVCFYVNKLLVSGLINEPVNQDFELLFETGVDEMNWDDLHDGTEDIWPALTEVKAYREQVYQLVRSIIQSHPSLEQTATASNVGWALAMAFEHERIHLETSSVLMRELPLEYVQQPASWPPMLPEPLPQKHEPEAGTDFPTNELIELGASTVKLGKPADWPSFGWDNEYGFDERQVSAFKATQFLISNGEFFQFVQSGGYEQRKYWSESGWGWRQFRNVKWPTFWVQDGPAGSHRYRLRTTFDEIPMQWSWPAVVNYYEARAYCAWLTEQHDDGGRFRLLHESEHHAIRAAELEQAGAWQPGTRSGLELDQVMNNNGQELVNHNLNFGSESAVDALPANSRGFHDSFGNVWQWCEDALHPLPGFEIHPYYTDFSTPCFDGEHQMILGGSFISTGDEASIWSRFHFRPHFFQHAGFRVVQEVEDNSKRGDKYDTDAVLNQYLLFHFGSEQEQRDQQLSERVGHPAATDLIGRTVELMNEFSSAKGSALDLGCAVGRASFELAREFDRVLGLDYSDTFVETAAALKEKGQLSYLRRETGHHSTKLLARVDPAIARERVDFVQGDASCLDATAAVARSAPYDAILLGNLLCRLAHPQNCLRQFVQGDNYLASGGILVIASPNTWLEQVTDPARFLDGEDSAATLAAIGKLLPGFSLLHEEDVPFMIRDHRRKYEYIISQVSVWRKD
jgi:5-histidylcysteine sulfoxide synthase/putative 4-mercaptohistidine N1-methyltranferase